MSIVDRAQLLRVSFVGPLDASWSEVDLVALFDNQSVGVGELVSLNVAIATAVGATGSIADLAANEHLGMSVYKLRDSTPGDVTRGDPENVDFVHEFIDPMAGYYWEKPTNIQADAILNVGTSAATPAITTLFEDGWNVQIPYQKVWLPEERPSWIFHEAGTTSTNEEALLWRIDGTPSVDTSIRGSLVYRYVPISWD